jgi:hypothetical protein
LLYLLDANTLITGENTAYPLARFPVFWEWLTHMGTNGIIKVPVEMYDEITVGRGPLVDWLTKADTRDALLFDEAADAARVSAVTLRGYGDLDDQEIESVGKDPFLISYGCADMANRAIVTFEVSSPRRQRANRKIPDVCDSFGIRWLTLFNLIRALDFTTNWRP